VVFCAPFCAPFLILHPFFSVQIENFHFFIKLCFEIFRAKCLFAPFFARKIFAKKYKNLKQKIAKISTFRPLHYRLRKKFETKFNPIITSRCNPSKTTQKTAHFNTFPHDKTAKIPRNQHINIRVKATQNPPKTTKLTA
jgi:hypothetical protein